MGWPPHPENSKSQAFWTNGPTPVFSYHAISSCNNSLISSIKCLPMSLRPLTHFISYHTKKQHTNKNHIQFSEKQNNWYRYTRWPFYKNIQTNGTQYNHWFFSSSLGVSSLGKLLSNATTEFKKEMRSKNYSCLFFPPGVWCLMCPLLGMQPRIFHHLQWN